MMDFLRARRRTPSVLQSENAECGLACLCMVFGFLGLNCDLAAMRRRFPIPYHGLKLADLLAIAKSFGITARILRLEPKDLRLLKCPAILHWDFSHYVVVTKATRKKLYINDPRYGASVIRLEEAQRSFTGIAVEFSKLNLSRASDVKGKLTLLELASSLLGYKRSIVSILILAIATQFLALMLPLYSQVVLNLSIQKLSLDLIPIFMLIAVSFFFVDGLLQLIRSYLSTRLSELLYTQFAGGLFTHLLSLPLAYFDARNPHELATKFEAVSELRTFLASDSIRIITESVGIFLLTIVLYIYHPALLLTSVVPMLAYCVFRFYDIGELRSTTEHAFHAKGREKNHFVETVRAIHTIKSYGVEGERISTWGNLLSDSQTYQSRLHFLTTRSGIAKDLAIKSDIILSIAIIAYMIAAGLTSYGAVVAIMAYKRWYTSSAGNLVEFFFKVNLLRPQLDRIADIVHTAPKPRFDDDANTNTRWESIDKLVIKEFGYTYPGEKLPCIDGVSFQVLRGEIAVITGPSGAGKTTLLKAIVGLLENYSGTIELNELDFSRAPQSVRARILGSVMQNDRLLEGSIAENISCFDADLCYERIERAAKIACIWDHIQSLSMGVETKIGESNIGLSAGQIQQVLLARAVYRAPLLLILDEATSNIDTRTEQLIIRNLRSLGLTILHAAHKKQVLDGADRVIHISNKTFDCLATKVV